MPQITTTRAGKTTEYWDYPVGAYGSYKLGDATAAADGHRYLARRGMQSGSEIAAAKRLIAEADVWGLLR